MVFGPKSLNISVLRALLVVTRLCCKRGESENCSTTLPNAWGFLAILRLYSRNNDVRSQGTSSTLGSEGVELGVSKNRGP